jgi:P pilus assembly chaperone PapD
LIIGQGDNRTQHWIGSVDIIDNQLTIENPTSDNISLNIEFDGNGLQWNISNGIVLESGTTTTVSAIEPETGISFAWFELNDGDVILHLVNHEV